MGCRRRGCRCCPRSRWRWARALVIFPKFSESSNADRYALGRQWCALDPQGEAWRSLAQKLQQTYEAAGEFEKAARIAAIALRWRPDGLEQIDRLRALAQTCAEPQGLAAPLAMALATVRDPHPLWPLALAYLAADQEDFAPAIAHFEQAQTLAIGSPLAAAIAVPLAIARYNQGRQRYGGRDYDGAFGLFLQALRDRPGDADTVAAVFSSAIAAGGGEGGYRAILGLRLLTKLYPQEPDYHWNLALHLLRNGDLIAGFQEYEWRLQFEQFQRDFLPYPAETRWDGRTDLRHGTLLVTQEQGLGDTIQFVRHLPAIAPRVGRLVFACVPSQVRLFAQSPAIAAVAAVVPLALDIPHDRHIPLMSLPHHLGAALTPCPLRSPYLRSPNPLPLPDGPPVAIKIGLVWSTGRDAPGHHNTHQQRSCPLDHFLALADRADVGLYSLQVGDADGAEFRQRTAHNPRCHDLAPHIHDFADTAAAIAALDLIITVDTATAHLAGALHKPVWILLPAEADWRWLRDRADSIWYPSARLFRQRVPGDWASVWRDLHQALGNGPHW